MEEQTGEYQPKAAVSATHGGAAQGVSKPWELYTQHQRWTFLFVLFLVGTSNYLDRNIVGVLLEPIKHEFRLPDVMLGLFSGISFALFYATLGLPIARWADRGDRRFLIGFSLAIWSVMTALCGLAQTFWQLAIARIGVGAGEAGAVPAAQSLIADYFPPEDRSKAIGVYMMCSMAGYVLGLGAGGWIAQNYGWRAAFIFVGTPGLALVLLTQFLLKEPRHEAKFAVRKQEQEMVSATFRSLLAKASYRKIIQGMTLYFVVAYGALVFFPSFMIRVHGFSIAQAGGLFGIISAAGALVGSLGGGYLADRLSKIDITWTARLPGWGLIFLLPIYEAALLADNVLLMAALLLVASILLTGAAPPMFTALHLVCGSARRAMAAAVVFFFANLIGLGLGPVIAGSLSDWLSKSYGPANGLRYALMIVLLVFIPSGSYMLSTAKWLRRDLED